MTEDETWVDLFVAKPHVVQDYHSGSYNSQIGIAERRRLRNGSSIHGKPATFAAGYVLAYD